MGYQVFQHSLEICLLSLHHKPELFGNLSEIWKAILSLTAKANEYSPDKEQTSYDDLLDALRPSLMH
jgi:hypothetical protein